MRGRMNLEHTCCSLVIPVYKNFGSLPPRLSALQGISAELLQRIPGATLEVVFVVDASPDASLDWLTAQLPGCGLKTQLFNVTLFQPSSIFLVCIAVLLVTALATALPAKRAARADAGVLLR